ncbi:MAG: hypothetical protein ACRCYF_17520, partial [Shewanella sp.]
MRKLSPLFFKRWVFGLNVILLCLYSSSLWALEKQDFEAICILIQSEKQDWHPTTPRYQELKARFDERCQQPVANGIKSLTHHPKTQFTARLNTPEQKPNLIPTE